MVPLRATDRCNASERTLRQLGTRTRAAVLNGDYLFHLSGFRTSGYHRFRTRELAFTFASVSGVADLAKARVFGAKRGVRDDAGAEESDQCRSHLRARVVG